VATRVAINGFGRIGRQALRAIHERHAQLEVVALNDLMDPKTAAHLFKHDSVLGPFHGDVELGDGVLADALRGLIGELDARNGNMCS